MALDNSAIDTTQLALGNFFKNFFNDANPQHILPLTVLKCSPHFGFSSTVTPSDFVFVIRLITESFNMSAFELFNVFTLREWPIIMYSVFAGLDLVYLFSSTQKG